MIIDSPRITSETLPTTVRTLRALLEQCTRALGELECELERSVNPTQKLAPKTELKYGYELFGKNFLARNENDVLVSILRHFSELDSSFPEHFSRATRRLSRKRLYVAQCRFSFYPKTYYLATVAKAFAPKWYVNTYEGTEKKLELLRCACKVLDLQLGKDLKIRMAYVKVPNEDA